ncbi:MAG TPA: hypothetical protein VNK24_09705 [Elusimicrobiota bacterium]|nr:hypothetical protein [Elusimicrobiota bacterium]
MEKKSGGKPRKDRGGKKKYVVPALVMAGNLLSAGGHWALASAL